MNHIIFTQAKYVFKAFVQLSERVFFFMGCDKKVGVFFRGGGGGRANGKVGFGFPEKLHSYF